MGILRRLFFVPEPSAADDAVDEGDVGNGAKDVRASGGLRLPKRRDDVEDWEPPIPAHVPHREQAQALVALFQSEGRFGAVPHWDLEASYAECAWVNGYIQITKLQLARALSTICTKVRLDVLSDEGEVIRAAHYVIPEPYKATADSPKSAPAGNVVPMRTKARRQAKASLRAERGQRNEARRTQSAGRKARYRADIAEAVACQG